VPSPAKPLFEAAVANFTPQSPAKVNTANKTRGPLLLTAVATITPYRRPHDLDPQALPQVTGHHRLHRVPRSRHSLTIDNGWREVAQAALDWLRQRSV